MDKKTAINELQSIVTQLQIGFGKLTSGEGDKLILRALIISEYLRNGVYEK